MSERRIFIRSAILPLLLLSSCASPHTLTTAAVTTHPPATATRSPDQPRELTPTVHATSAPTTTLLPPPRRLADPDSPLNSTGPWLSFWTEDAHSNRRLFIANADGSGMTELDICEDCSWPAISDASPFVAYVRSNLTSMIKVGEPPVAELVIVEIPSLEERNVIDLLASPDSKEIEDLGSSDLFEIVRLSRPSWSPDGSAIAFSASIDAPNVDLYTFRIVEARLARQSSGPNHAWSPRWSTDGRSLIYAEVQKVPLGYEIDDLGVWAADVESGDNRWLYAPNGHHELLEWVDAVHAITYSHRWDRSFGPEVDIRVTNIRKGTSEMICRDACDPSRLALDRRHGLVVFERHPNTEWYAMDVNDGTTVQLPDVEGLDPPSWSEEAEGLVFAAPDPWAEADCEGIPGHHYVQADQSLGCTTANVLPLANPSPSGEWSISADAVLRSADQVVLRYMDDLAFQSDSFDSYFDTFDVEWRPDSLGAFLHKPESLFYVDVPSGSPVLVHKGDSISSLQWIVASQ